MRTETDKLLKRYDQLHASRAHYIRCFNRLEKAVTNHIQGCIDSGDLEHAHQAVMRDLIAGAPPREVPRDMGNVDTWH